MTTTAAADPISPAADEKSAKRFRNALVLTSIFLASAMLPGVPGAPARAMIETFDDAKNMTLVSRDQVLYLQEPHLVDAQKNIWQVRAKYNADGDWNKDGFTLTVKPSLVNKIWYGSLRDDGFVPDRIIAPIPPGPPQQFRVTFNGSVLHEKLGLGQLNLLSLEPAAQKASAPCPAPMRARA